MGAVKDFVLGGKQKIKQGNQFGPISEDETNRLSEIEAQIEAVFGEQSSLGSKNSEQAAQIQNLFVNNLKGFLAAGGQQTQEQLQQAANFVDNIFTQPAQQVVNQNIADFQSQAQAQAAALGRNPNLDIATQQAILGEGLRQNVGLQAQRGSMIQQQSETMANRGLQGLQMGAQGSSFLNSLSQQAFANRMGLLNARSGLADFYQRDRARTGGVVQTSPGLLGTISNATSQIQGVAAPIAGFMAGGPIGGAIGASLAGPQSAGAGSAVLDPSRYRL